MENIFFRFEWSVPEDKVKEHTLDITVKNDVSFFSKSKTSMGQVWSYFFGSLNKVEMEGFQYEKFFLT